MSAVIVAGVGMTAFTTPSRSPDYDVLAETAVRAALSDAGLPYDTIEQAYAGYVYGDSACGQRSLYRLGATGIPIINVNNNCSSGSTALWLARNTIRSGSADCVLAVGFEQMRRGPIVSWWSDRPDPLRPFVAAAETRFGAHPDVPMTPFLFGAAALDYTEKWGTDPNLFAHVAVKARRHAARSPHAVFRDPLTIDEVLASPALFGPLTRLQACPPTCGAAAVVLCSPTFADRHRLDTGVRILGQGYATDTATSFDPTDLAYAVGYGITDTAARQAYTEAGIEPHDLDVVELHDCFTVNEILSYEALGLTDPGTADHFVHTGNGTYGGTVVVNPSGGLLSKGHPLGATGLAQITELTWQLRAASGTRQVEGARLALQHNIGLGGAAVVTVLAAA